MTDHAKYRPTTAELKPCPFCGGKAEYVDYGQEGEFEDWDVECTECHALMIAPGKEPGEVTTKLEAAAAWNRRAQDAALPARP